MHVGNFGLTIQNLVRFMDEAVEVYNTAVEYFNRGMFDEASVLVSSLPQFASDIDSLPEYNILQAKITFQCGRQALAIEMLEKAYLRHPSHRELTYSLADMLVIAGSPKRAAYFLRKGYQIDKYKGREDIFVFGDSHAEFCFSAIPRCRAHRLGSMTMHRVGRDGLAAVDARSFGAPDGAALVFLFGEVDVRAHILRQRDEAGRALEEIIATLCRNYVQTCCLNRDVVPQSRVVICSLVPATSSPVNKALPMYGSLAERIIVTRQINAVLAELCGQNGLHFLKIAHYFSDRCGALSRGMSDGVVHIRQDYSDIIEYELERTLKL